MTQKEKIKEFFKWLNDDPKTDEEWKIRQEISKQRIKESLTLYVGQKLFNILKQKEDEASDNRSTSSN